MLRRNAEPPQDALSFCADDVMKCATPTVHLSITILIAGVILECRNGRGSAPEDRTDYGTNDIAVYLTFSPTGEWDALKGVPDPNGVIPSSLRSRRVRTPSSSRSAVKTLPCCEIRQTNSGWYPGMTRPA
jgi:hypothetical protein